MPVCLRGQDVGLPHFAGRQFAVVKIWEDAGTKFVVWAFVWESVVGQHWVCGDVCDVKLECDLVGVRSGVEGGMSPAAGWLALRTKRRLSMS